MHDDVGYGRRAHSVVGEMAATMEELEVLALTRTKFESRTDNVANRSTNHQNLLFAGITPVGHPSLRIGDGLSNSSSDSNKTPARISR